MVFTVAQETNSNTALFCKLDGVAEQVDDDLTQAVVVTI